MIIVPSTLNGLNVKKTSIMQQEDKDKEKIYAQKKQ